MFLEFMAPVWVALLAPRVFHGRTEPIVYWALVLALVGLAVILWPTHLAARPCTSRPPGVAAGMVSGLGYATFQLIVKDLTNRGVGGRHHRDQRDEREQRRPAAAGAVADRGRRAAT